MIRLREETFLLQSSVILIINVSFFVQTEGNRVIGVLHWNWIPLFITFSRWREREGEKSLIRFLFFCNHARSERTLLKVRNCDDNENS
jgi:hypothetical protein